MCPPTLEQLSHVNIVPRFFPFFVTPPLALGTLCDTGSEIESSLSSMLSGSKVRSTDVDGATMGAGCWAPLTLCEINGACEIVGEARDNAAIEDRAELVCNEAGLLEYDRVSPSMVWL